MASSEHVTAAARDHTCRICEVRDKAICNALSDQELRKLCKISTPVKLHADGIVFYEADDRIYPFNVICRSFRLPKRLPDGRCQVTGLLFPGNFLGLAASGVCSYIAENPRADRILPF